MKLSVIFWTLLIGKIFFVKDLNVDHLSERYKEIIGAQYDGLGTGEAIIKNWADKKIQEWIVNCDFNKYSHIDKALKKTISQLKYMKKNIKTLGEMGQPIILNRIKVSPDILIPEELECYFFLCALSEGTIFYNDAFLEIYKVYLKKDSDKDDISDEAFAKEMYAYIKRSNIYRSTFDYIIDIIEKNKLYE